MKAVKEINIYLLKKRNAQNIDVVQYDTGIQLVFNVLDFEIPTGTTATLYVQKPSGKPVYQENGITIADNTIVIELENQAISEYGKAPYQITLTNGNDEISTFSGILNVEKRVVDSESAVENSTVVTVKLNELSVGIKGYLSGAVISADDVSPIEHRPKVKVICPDGIDPLNVKVTRCGKNLFNKNGVTKDYILEADGTLKYVASDGGCVSEYIKVVPFEVYYITLVSSHRAKFFDKDKIPLSNEFDVVNISGGGSFVVPENAVYIRFTTYSSIVDSIQLECGTKPTNYEAYKDEEYTPNANGTVDGVTTLSPCMTLLTDTDGVTIECEYIKDTNKVIAKIADAINAMGGEITI